MKTSRIIDTFAARDLQRPSRQNPRDSLSEYTEQSGHELELRRRRARRKKQMVI